ncbi:hypothetical protein I131_06190 [Enterococcus faecium CRL1879]|nr:hypothetical protein I131_06190 [Enterococcus faecium CRL1879]
MLFPPKNSNEHTLTQNLFYYNILAFKIVPFFKIYRLTKRFRHKAITSKKKLLAVYPKKIEKSTIAILICVLCIGLKKVSMRNERKDQKLSR